MFDRPQNTSRANHETFLEIPKKQKAKKKKKKEMRQKLKISRPLFSIPYAYLLNFRSTRFFPRPAMQ